MLEFNINRYCWVQLTDRGRKILEDKWSPEEDENGWSRWQMHDLMLTFGDVLYPGFGVPFNPDIRIETNGNV